MRERMRDRVSLALALALAALVGIELLFAPHHGPVFPWHHLPGYAAVIGLAGCIMVVQISKALGSWLLQRPEDDE